ncbi:hypothetical protein EGT74_19715 [Chitinophaga lutea]|uniref:Pectate lyase superfamily protein domain-containing protein n=1 Tax=Chitinophaga lutea TaxID=2488634 RepID=A0A3N4PZV1_9BACT|nr:hypothetical protein [Chitinophaga lutea]RPE09230.1 hypothetical protein EGT74_19715 [Chitinophaga lutea]
MTKNTIADLKAYTGTTPNELVTVLGYHAPADGGGGDFYWNATSAAGEDGGTVFTTGQPTGRWIRIETFPVNVKWFGAKGVNTDDTQAVQKALDYCRTTGVRKRLLFPDGTYELGKVDITGVRSLEGLSNKVWIRGKQLQDIFYWKGAGEAGYIKVEELTIKNFTITLETSADSRATYKRVGFGGERIGNCAIHLPGEGVGYLFEDVFITKSGGGTIAGYGGCGVFFTGAPYKVNVNGRLEIRSCDYGFVMGVSETHKDLSPTQITAIDAAANTFTGTPLPANGDQVALLYDVNERQLVSDTDASVLAIRPRKRYYVTGVNAGAGTFQLAASAGGAAIAFNVADNPEVEPTPDPSEPPAPPRALPPQTFMIPAGGHPKSIEFAADEWSIQQLITAQTMRCGLSVTNIYQCGFGTFGCQSSRAAIRVLNYDSKIRYANANVSFDEMYTEGPFDIAYMKNREYVRIEGFGITVHSGPRHITAGSIQDNALNNYITFDTNYSVFNAVGINLNSKLKVPGDGNIIKGRLMGKESNLDNQGLNNQITFHRDETGGDSQQSFAYLSRFSLSKAVGGFWPDHVFKGNAGAPHQSDQVLFFPAATQIYVGSPALQYLTDPALDANAYVRFSATGALRLRNPFGTLANTLTIGRYFPKMRWMLYAKVRSISGTKDVTLAFADVAGSTTYNVSQTHSVGTNWQIISVEADHRTAPDGLNGELLLTPATTGLDVAYFVIVPFAGETFSVKTNFGGNVLDLAGPGTPEGAVTAAVGSTYRRTDGGTGSTFYIKESGTGTTGWTAL